MPPSEAEARARVLSRLLFVVPRLWLQDFTADGSAPRCVNKWARWLHLREREREEEEERSRRERGHGGGVVRWRQWKEASV
jgi:hypothetical protein